jgi:hypothetical protein
MSSASRAAMPPEAPAFTAYSHLSRARLEAMAVAGAEVLECYRVLTKSGDNPIRELLRGGGRFLEWRHYPKDDVYDHETGAQYYYHAHPIAERGGGEHGHVHTFLRPKGMPARCKPAPLPDREALADPNDALSHLIAVSVDRRGVPVMLFTTNRWVTGETWYGARDVIAMLDRFEIDLARPSWPANRWITALVRLFRPQIEALVRGRDATIEAWARANPGKNAYEFRGLEVVTRASISIDAQMENVRRALARRTSARSLTKPAKGRRGRTTSRSSSTR